MDRNEIIVISGFRIADMAYELCRVSGLADMIRSSCGREDPLIAMKPNLVGPIPAGEGATTHPEIIEGVAGYLRAEGFRNLAVMEGSWVGDRTQDALMVTGTGPVCDKLGIPFTDLQSDDYEAVDCAGMTIKICRRALEADYLINLPVMKGHCQTRMTCALKNMKGCIPNQEKRRFHRMGLHDPIGHLAAGIRQDFIIADAICPDLTFEDGGNPVEMNRMMCAVDPVLMDAYSCSVIGVDQESVPYIRIAEECGAGSGDISGAKVSVLLEKMDGDTPAYIRGDLPALQWNGDYRQILKIKEMVEDIDSCSACYGTLIPVLRRLEKEGLLHDLPGRIGIGQGYRGKTGNTGIGSCTSGFDISLPGCPPSADDMYEFLRKALSR